MKLFLSVFSTVAAIALALPHNAQASVYSTSNNKTLIEFKELPGTAVVGGAIGEGRYTTTIGTQEWMGSVTTTSIPALSGIVAKNFPLGSIITAGAKLVPNAFVTAGGASWLSVRTSQGKYCFVRANTSYIKPQLMPF